MDKNALINVYRYRLAMASHLGHSPWLNAAELLAVGEHLGRAALAALLLKDAGAAEYWVDYQARADEIRAAAMRNARPPRGVTE